jgi:hypothetical protein
MDFVEENGDFFYVCRAFPKCNVMHRAHPDGNPMGKPADARTRKFRVLAHEAFDRLWLDYRGKINRAYVRKLAYEWLRKATGMTSCHIGSLNEYGCKQVMTACQGVTTEQVLSVLRKDIMMTDEEKRRFIMGIKPKRLL